MAEHIRIDLLSVVAFQIAPLLPGHTFATQMHPTSFLLVSLRSAFSREASTCLHAIAPACTFLCFKGYNAVFYVVQYPVRWTVRTSKRFTLHPVADLFTPAPTRLLWEACPSFETAAEGIRTQVPSIESPTLYCHAPRIN